MRDPIETGVPAELDDAIRLMTRALAILDRTGPVMAAISLSQAIDQAGGQAPSPDDHHRMFGVFG